MHLSRNWLASLLAVAGFTGLASAQCCWNYPIPRAPDMSGPGYYYYNCQGWLYGPVHWVRPPFPPHQGYLPGPPAAMMAAYKPYGMMPGMAAFPQYQPPGGGDGGMGPGGYPGMWSNPYVRSPRDFFMYGEDPAASPYRYGGASASPTPAVTDRVIPPPTPAPDRVIPPPGGER